MFLVLSFFLSSFFFFSSSSRSFSCRHSSGAALPVTCVTTVFRRANLAGDDLQLLLIFHLLHFFLLFPFTVRFPLIFPSFFSVFSLSFFPALHALLTIFRHLSAPVLYIVPAAVI